VCLFGFWRKGLPFRGGSVDFLAKDLLLWAIFQYSSCFVSSAGFVGDFLYSCRDFL
jgi:hypothetical protein